MSTLDKAFIRAYTKYSDDSKANNLSAASAHASPLGAVAVTFADGVWCRVDRPTPAHVTPPHITIRKREQRSVTDPPAGDTAPHVAEHTKGGENETRPSEAAPAMSSATFALTAAMESAVRGWQSETEIAALPSNVRPLSPLAASEHQPAAPSDRVKRASVKRASTSLEQEISSPWEKPYFGAVEMLLDFTELPILAIYEDWGLPAPAAEEIIEPPCEESVAEPCFQWVDEGYSDTDSSNDLLTNLLVATDECDALAIAETIIEADVELAEDANFETAPPPESLSELPPKLREATAQIAPSEESTIAAGEQPAAVEQPVIEQPVIEQPVVEQHEVEQVVAEEPAVATDTAAQEPKVFAPSWEVDQFKWPPIVDKLVCDEHDQLEQVAVRLLEEARDGKNLLAVTGGVRGEGRTTLVLSLARLASQLGNTVAIVDADFGHQEVGPQLGLDITQGWECVVSQGLRLEEVAVVSLSDRLTAFPLGSSSSERPLDGERISAVLQQLAELFELVLVDLGPLEATGEQVVTPEKTGLAARAILVQDARRPNDAQLHDIVQRLESYGIEALGVVETFRPAA